MPELGRVLIADDEENFREVIRDFLREEGYTCECVADAASALTELRAREYDLLVADIKMPGNEELELIEQVPALVAGLPVILVTGYPALNTAIKSTRLAVVGYLLKPVPLEDFLKLVQQGILRYQTQRMFGKARKRLEEAQREWGDLESLKSLAPTSPALVDVDVFLHYTLKNMIASMIDLKELAQALAQNKPKQQACQLLNCPRHVELTQALRDAILVLEKTKNAFKSKELGALRQSLERTLGAPL
ncbi:MAG: response regulator [candidate division KSB1 bacterium]